MNKKITPLKAIREKCLDCCCGQTKEVKNCLIPDCSLFPFRFGKNPYQKKNLTENDRKVLREQLAKNFSE